MNVDDGQHTGLLSGATQVDTWRKSAQSHLKEEIAEFDKENKGKSTFLVEI